MTIDWTRAEEMARTSTGVPGPISSRVDYAASAAVCCAEQLTTLLAGAAGFADALCAVARLLARRPSLCRRQLELRRCPARCRPGQREQLPSHRLRLSRWRLRGRSDRRVLSSWLELSQPAARATSNPRIISFVFMRRRPSTNVAVYGATKVITMNAAVKGGNPKLTSGPNVEFEWRELTAGSRIAVRRIAPECDRCATRRDCSADAAGDAQRAICTRRCNSRRTTRDTICASIDRLASRRLQWRQNPNYVGADFLDGYAYCELVGPRGHLQHADVALGLLLLGPRVTYPEHAHPAAEIYGVVAGRAEWLQGDRIWRRRTPGELIRSHDRWSRTRCARPPSRCSPRTFGRIISATVRGW